MGSWRREEAAVLLPTCISLVEVPHSKKCLVGGTQLQFNLITSTVQHDSIFLVAFPHVSEASLSPYMKSSSGSCIWERKKHERSTSQAKKNVLIQKSK